MFRFDCTFSNFNCTKSVQLHTILRPDYTRLSVCPVSAPFTEHRPTPLCTATGLLCCLYTYCRDSHVLFTTHSVVIDWTAVVYVAFMFTGCDKACQFNPLIATLKPQSNQLSYSNTVIGTLVGCYIGTARSD